MWSSCRLWTIVVSAAATSAGCNALFGIDDLSYEGRTPTTSAGGTGGVGAASSTAGAGGAAGSASMGGSGGRAGSGGAAGAGGAGGAGGQPEPATCNAQYGAVAQYVLCTQTASRCTFFAQLAGSSCGPLCQANGGECLGAYHNTAPQSCSLGAVITCQEVLADAICVCSRGCGGGPPCSTGEICSSGSCT